MGDLIWEPPCLECQITAAADFGWPCGGTFIPNRAKCWTDPKSGRRLKVPINHQTYQKIVGTKGKAAQTLYKDREQAIRERRRAAVPGWKKQEDNKKISVSDKYGEGYVKISIPGIRDQEIPAGLAKKYIDHFASPVQGTKEQLGKAFELRKGSPIKTEEDFEKEFNKAFDLINEEFKLDGKVPAWKLRRSLGDRVRREDFDSYVTGLQADEKFLGWQSKDPFNNLTAKEKESAIGDGAALDNISGAGGSVPRQRKTVDGSTKFYTEKIDWTPQGTALDTTHVSRIVNNNPSVKTEKQSSKPVNPGAPKPALNLDGNYKDTPHSPKESNKKLIKAEDLKSAADREAYATLELAEAKKSGDQSRIKSWEEQAKKARMAKLKSEQQAQKTTQTSLFNPLAYDKDLQGGLPLFKKRIKRRADFSLSKKVGTVLFRMPINAEFGWKCGDTFIPNNRKCYTDPKTGIKLKTPLTFKQYTKQRAQVYRDAQRGQLPQNDYDRSLLQSVGNAQVKLKSQKEKLQLTQAAASVGARQVLPSGIAEVEVSKLHVDPKRFQYKILGAQTQSGSVGSLSGVKTWDANLAGIIQVWQDPKDKRVYVVNGHNRTERAKALGVKTMTAKFIKAKSPEEARAVGALTNIAESKGTSLDAAKFFRDSGVSREDLERKGIPMREKIATDGLALSRLNEPLFNRVVQGTLPEQRAVTIGSALKDHKQQQELVDLIEKEEKRGKKINNDAIAELTDMVVGAPKVQQSQGGLFDLLGFTPETRSLAVEKAQLQAGIKRQLSREKKLFGTVGKSRAAEDLAKAGNQINVAESAEISETASKALDAFDKEKNLSGATSTAINRAAERIANGENPKKVEKEVYDEILTDLQKTYKFGEGSGSKIAKRRINSNSLAASRYHGQTAEFGTGLKRRLKRRKRHCCCA